jgi:magnesium transporter
MSLDVHAHGLLLKEQSVLRQRLIELRRVTLAQRDMLQPFVRGEYDYISGALEQRFSHVHDHLTKVIEQLDNLRERLSNVRENYHTAVAVRTNEIMKTLTMFATVMLPLTLVAGIYGMNLRFWPPQEEPYSFGFVLACMAAITLVLVVYFRRKRWL